ncbi:hypothetical protein T265_02003 [Opisthorchis viverrini]|uniref:Uncharacterized protein n=2 Tax=Opisthorchis viverrini TaxID=6198 RepID=A0A075A0J7_OPIVI|nr:hypothetical protein T265_02003 [Opisthorchis viverrini]KER31767.1 hypothetical protein T265_02003 [Opisthorchis viverrini]
MSVRVYETTEGQEDDSEANACKLQLVQYEESISKDFCAGCKIKLAHLFSSKVFHLTIVILCCLDGLLVICVLLLEIEALKLKSSSDLRPKLVNVQFAIECCSVAIVFLFVIEIPFKLWIFGCRMFFHNWLEIIDALVCLVSFAADTYSIIQHTLHHYTNTDRPQSYMKTSPSNATQEMMERFPVEESTASNTIVDAAALLILFRLWRVVRIINAIVISVTTGQEQSSKVLRASLKTSQDRVAQLEQILRENFISFPEQPDAN